MKRKVTFLVLTLLTSLLLYTTASAQRTMSGQPSLRVSSLYNGRFVGAEAFFEQYTLSGYWLAGIQGNLYNAPLSTGHKLEYVHALAQGGYMFRLAGSRNRSLSFYAGAGAVAGVEVLDPWRALPDYVDVGRGKYAFIYGPFAAGALEWFVAPRFAVVLQASLPLTFGSGIGVVNWNAGLGLKWNL